MVKIGCDFYQHKYIAGGNMPYKWAVYLSVFSSLVNSSFSRKVSEFALLLIVWWRVYMPEKNPDSSLDNVLKLGFFLSFVLFFVKKIGSCYL